MRLACQIEPKYVEPWIPGGQAVSKYDHEAYWQEEMRQYETYMKFLQNEFLNKTPVQRRAENALFASAIAEGKSVQDAIQIARTASAETLPTGLLFSYHANVSVLNTYALYNQSETEGEAA